MFEAYSVAVKLSLINNVSSGLLAISKNLKSTHMDAAKLEEKLKSIGKQVALGGAMFGGGLAIMGMFKTPLQDAMKYQKELAKLQQMGLGSSQIADAQKFVQATQIIGSSMMDRMKLFAEAQGAFRESGMLGGKALEAAKVMMPVLTKYQIASNMLSDEKHAAAEHGMLSLNRLVEQMGGLNDPKRAAAIVDGAFRAVAASGRMITPDQLRQFRSYGGAAVANYTDKAIFASLEPVIGELKGSTAGMGLRTAWARANGLIKPPNQMAHEYIGLGMWDARKIVFNSQGGIKKLNGNPLRKEYADLMNTNPVAFAEKVMATYQAHHIAQNDWSRLNTMLFGTNGSKVYDLMMRQMKTLHHSEQAYDASKGIDATVKNNANSPVMQAQKLTKAMDDLKLAIGQNLLPVFTPLVTDIADLARELGRHPRLVKDVTFAFVGLSGVLMLGGVINGLIATGRALNLLSMATAGLDLMKVVRGMNAITLASSRMELGVLAANLGKVGTALAVLGAAASVFMAAYAGWEAGKAIYNNLDGKTKNDIGGTVATVLAWFGNKDAQHALDINDGNGALGRMRYPAVPPRQQVVVNINQPINLDGKKIAQNTTMHQAREASRPPTGTSAIDPRMAQLYPNLSSLNYGR